VGLSITLYPAIQMVTTISAEKLKLDLIPKTKQEVAVSGDRFLTSRNSWGKIENIRVLNNVIRNNRWVTRQST
jgi:hypothetical protein